MTLPSESLEIRGPIENSLQHFMGGELLQSSTWVKHDADEVAGSGPPCFVGWGPAQSPSKPQLGTGALSLT